MGRRGANGLNDEFLHYIMTSDTSLNCNKFAMAATGILTGDGIELPGASSRRHDGITLPTDQDFEAAGKAQLGGLLWLQNGQMIHKLWDGSLLELT